MNRGYLERRTVWKSLRGCPAQAASPRRSRLIKPIGALGLATLARLVLFSATASAAGSGTLVREVLARERELNNSLAPVAGQCDQIAMRTLQWRFEAKTLRLLPQASGAAPDQAAKLMDGLRDVNLRRLRLLLVGDCLKDQAVERAFQFRPFIEPKLFLMPPQSVPQASRDLILKMGKKEHGLWQALLASRPDCQALGNVFENWLRDNEQDLSKLRQEWSALPQAAWSTAEEKQRYCPLDYPHPAWAALDQALRPIRATIKTSFEVRGCGLSSAQIGRAFARFMQARVEPPHTFCGPPAAPQAASPHPVKACHHDTGQGSIGKGRHMTTCATLSSNGRFDAETTTDNKVALTGFCGMAHAYLLDGSDNVLARVGSPQYCVDGRYVLWGTSLRKELWAAQVPPQTVAAAKKLSVFHTPGSKPPNLEEIKKWAKTIVGLAAM